MGAVGAVAGAAAGGGSMSWLGPAGLVAGGLLGGVSSIFNNERNLSSQADAQNYSKWLNERTWEREDSAVQRRVADLRRAGLSPVLAAGSSAQTGSPIKIDPQVSQDAWGAEGAISGVTRAAQTQQSLMAARAAQAQVGLLEANEKKAKIEAEMTDYELRLWKETGKYPRGSGGMINDIKDLVNFYHSRAGQKLRQGAVDLYDSYEENLPEFLRTKASKDRQMKKPTLEGISIPRGFDWRTK